MPVRIIDATEDLPRKRKSPRKADPDGPLPWSFPCKEYAALLSPVEADEEFGEPGLLPGFLNQGKPPAGGCRCPN